MFFTNMCLAKFSTDPLHEIAADLKSTDLCRRFSAATALSEIRDPRAVPLLLSAMGDQVMAVRKAVSYALLEHAKNDPSIFQIIKEKINDSDANVRDTAMDFVGQSSYEDAVNLLLKGLEDPAEQVRITAITFLGIRKEKKAIPQLLRFLEAGANECTAAKNALISIADESIIPKIISKASHEKEHTRQAVAEILGYFPVAPNNVSTLLRLLRDPSRNVRISAIESLGKLRREHTADALIEMANDEDVETAVAAIYALSMIPHEKVVKTLIKLCGSEKRKIRTAAAVALYRLRGGDPDFLKEMACATFTEYRRESAILMIGLSRNPAYIPFLEQKLKDDSMIVRIAVVHALAKMPSNSAINALLFALTDHCENVRVEAASAIQYFAREHLPDSPIKTIVLDIASTALSLDTTADDRMWRTLKTALVDAFKKLRETAYHHGEYINLKKIDEIITLLQRRFST